METSQRHLFWIKGREMSCCCCCCCCSCTDIQLSEGNSLVVAHRQHSSDGRCRLHLSATTAVIDSSFDIGRLGFPSQCSTGVEQSVIGSPIPSELCRQSPLSDKSWLQFCSVPQIPSHDFWRYINLYVYVFVPSVLWRCWLGGRKGIRPVKTEWWGAGMVICPQQGADLHMAQLMPLPLTVSSFSKIQIGFTFLVLARPGSPGKRAIKRACVCTVRVKCLCLTVIQCCSCWHGAVCVCGLWQSYEWMSRVLQAVDSIHQVGIYCLALVPPNYLPKVSVSQFIDM